MDPVASDCLRFSPGTASGLSAGTPHSLAQEKANVFCSVNSAVSCWPQSLLLHYSIVGRWNVRLYASEILLTKQVINQI